MSKNLIFYWLLALVISVSSCNKDDNPFPNGFEFPSNYNLDSTSINISHFWKAERNGNPYFFHQVTQSEYLSVAGEFEDLTVDDIIDSMSNSWVLATELHFIDEQNVNLLGQNYFGERIDIEGLKYKWEGNYLTIFWQDGEESQTLMSAFLFSDGRLSSYSYVYQYFKHENGPLRSPFIYEIVDKYSGSSAILENIGNTHGLKRGDLIMMVEKRHIFTR